MFQNKEALNLQQQKKEKLFTTRTKLSYYKICHRKFVGYGNEKAQKQMNKPVYLGMSMIELSKIVMY